MDTQPSGLARATLQQIFHRSLGPRVGEGYAYPPTTALLFLPTAALEFATATRLVRMLSVLAVGVCLAVEPPLTTQIVTRSRP